MELKSLDQIGIAKVKVGSPSSDPKANESTRVASSDASVSELTGTKKRNQLFESRNNLINIANIASSGVEEAVELVNSLVSTSVGREEVGSVTKKLSQIAERETPDGKKPLAGEFVSIPTDEGERSVQFPSDVVESFGLSNEKEPSEKTIREVQERLDDFRNRSEEILTSIRESISTLEVAAQNSEASLSSVRGLDSAVSLADTTGVSIGLDPNEALESSSGLSPVSLRLIE